MVSLLFRSVLNAMCDSSPLKSVAAMESDLHVLFVNLLVPDRNNQITSINHSRNFLYFTSNNNKTNTVPSTMSGRVNSGEV